MPANSVLNSEHAIIKDFALVLAFRLEEYNQLLYPTTEFTFGDKLEDYSLKRRENLIKTRFFFF